MPLITHQDHRGSELELVLRGDILSQTAPPAGLAHPERRRQLRDLVVGHFGAFRDDRQLLSYYHAPKQQNSERKQTVLNYLPRNTVLRNAAMKQIREAVE